MIINNLGINEKYIIQIVKTCITDRDLISQRGGRSKIIVLTFINGNHQSLYFKTDEECEQAFMDIYCEMKKISKQEYYASKNKYKDF